MTISQTNNNCRATPLVSIVTVTYGDRWNYLHQVLAAVNDHPAVTDIVVVDNGSTYDVAARVTEQSYIKVRIVSMGENTGSAKGFASGIQAALECSSAQFLWLLDDDNKPLPGALNNLLLANQLLGLDEHCALLSLRRDRSEYYKAVTDGRKVSVINNSFYSFHLKNIPAKIAQKLSSRSMVSDAIFFPIVSIDYAPYGGFFFHRQWIAKIGLPNPDYFLYGDDHEFTNRIVKQGGCIFLCAASEIVDLEISWQMVKRKDHPLISSSSDPMRIYYTIRNRVHYELSGFAPNRLVYFCNVGLYLLCLFFASIFSGAGYSATNTRMRLIVRAIRDGYHGNLGRRKSVCL